MLILSPALKKYLKIWYSKLKTVKHRAVMKDQSKTEDPTLTLTYTPVYLETSSLYFYLVGSKIVFENFCRAK